MAVAVDGTKRLARVTPGGKNKVGVKKAEWVWAHSWWCVRVGGRVEGGQPTASVCCFDSMMRLKDSLAVCWEQRLNIWPYLRLSLLHWFIYLYFVLFVSSCWTVSATMESADWRRAESQHKPTVWRLFCLWKLQQSCDEVRVTAMNRGRFRVGGSGQVFPPCLW